MLVDSHCHLNNLTSGSQQETLQPFLERAQSAGVAYCLNIATSLENTPETVAVANKYQQVFSAIGLHPLEIPATDAEINEASTILTELAQEKKVVAIGETGLDYYYTQTNQKLQQAFFKMQLVLAKKLKLPIVIHSRSAKEDTLHLMDQFACKQTTGVMHCFTESWDMAKSALDMGFYISISGIVTFKNAQKLRDVLTKIPLNRLLIETDAPYLAPVPMRGKSNEPAYLRHTARFIADLLDITVEKLGKITTDNFFQLFAKAAP